MKWIRSPRVFWLLAPVTLAAVCAALRQWQLMSAFEGDLGLHISRAPASVILTCMLVIAAALFLMLTMRQAETMPPRGARHMLWRKSGMVAKGDAICLTLTVGAAFLSLAAAPVTFFRAMELREQYQIAIMMGQTGGNNGVLMIIAAVTSLAGFVGLLLAGRDRFRGVVGGKGESMILLAAVNGCLWLMESYRGHAADPVLWDYVPLLLAVICGMLFYMDCAGLNSGAFHPRRTLWLAGMTVVLSVLAMIGSGEVNSILLLLSQSLAALAVLWRLPKNMECPPEMKASRGSEQNRLEEDNYV